MRSVVVQKHVQNLMNNSLESRWRPRSHHTPSRPHSAKMATRVIKYHNLDEDPKFRLNYPRQPYRSDESPKNESSRIIGRQLVYEKERLYQEQFQLKRTVHALQDENMKLRTRLQQFEAMTQKYEKMLEEVDSIGPAKPQFQKYTTEAHLTNALKKELKQVKVQLLAKEDEASKLKRHLKYTKIQELEIERKGFSDETIRLKHLLEQTIQASLLYMTDNNISQDIQDKLIQQTQQIQQLKLIKVDLESVIARLQRQCLQYKTHSIEVETKFQKEIKKLRQTLVEKGKELDQLRPQAKAQRPRYDESQIKLMQKEIETLKKQLMERSRDQVRGGTPQVESIKETEIVAPMMQQWVRPEEFDSQTSERPISNNRFGSSDQENRHSLKIVGTSVEGPIKENRRLSVQSQHGVRKINPIQFHEVKWIGETLRYRLRAWKIDWKDIDQYIFSSQMIEDGFSKLGDIKIHLQKFPFDLAPQHANLVARYMVENDSEGTVAVDMQQSNPIVKSVLRKVIGVYSVDELQDLQIRLKLQETLSKYKTYICDAIKSQIHKNKTISKQQFEDCLLTLGLELSSVEVDYILVQGILESASVNHLNYIEMLKFIPDYDPNKGNTLRSEQSQAQKSGVNTIDIERRVDNTSRQQEAQRSEKRYSSFKVDRDPTPVQENKMIHEQRIIENQDDYHVAKGQEETIPQPVDYEQPQWDYDPENIQNDITYQNQSDTNLKVSQNQDYEDDNYAEAEFENEKQAESQREEYDQDQHEYKSEELPEEKEANSDIDNMEIIPNQSVVSEEKCKEDSEVAISERPSNYKSSSRQSIKKVDSIENEPEYTPVILTTERIKSIKSIKSGHTQQSRPHQVSQQDRRSSRQNSLQQEPSYQYSQDDPKPNQEDYQDEYEYSVQQQSERRSQQPSRSNTHQSVQQGVLPAFPKVEDYFQEFEEEETKAKPPSKQQSQQNFSVHSIHSSRQFIKNQTTPKSRDQQVDLNASITSQKTNKTLQEQKLEAQSKRSSIQRPSLRQPSPKFSKKSSIQQSYKSFQYLDTNNNEEQVNGDQEMEHNQSQNQINSKVQSQAEIDGRDGDSKSQVQQDQSQVVDSQLMNQQNDKDDKSLFEESRPKEEGDDYADDQYFEASHLSEQKPQEQPQEDVQIKNESYHSQANAEVIQDEKPESQRWQNQDAEEEKYFDNQGVADEAQQQDRDECQKEDTYQIEQQEQNVLEENLSLNFRQEVQNESIEHKSNKLDNQEEDEERQHQQSEEYLEIGEKQVFENDDLDELLQNQSEVKSKENQELEENQDNLEHNQEQNEPSLDQVELLNHPVQQDSQPQLDASQVQSEQILNKSQISQRSKQSAPENLDVDQKMANSQTENEQALQILSRQQSSESQKPQILSKQQSVRISERSLAHSPSKQKSQTLSQQNSIPNFDKGAEDVIQQISFVAADADEDVEIQKPRHAQLHSEQLRSIQSDRSDRHSKSHPNE